MALVLVAVGLFVYSRVGSDLDTALDQSLRTRADDVAAIAGSTSSTPSKACASAWSKATRASRRSSARTGPSNTRARACAAHY